VVCGFGVGLVGVVGWCGGGGFFFCVLGFLGGFWGVWGFVVGVWLVVFLVVVGVFVGLVFFVGFVPLHSTFLGNAGEIEKGGETKT